MILNKTLISLRLAVLSLDFNLVSWDHRAIVGALETAYISKKLS
jgi:hypothetical protein